MLLSAGITGEFAFVAVAIVVQDELADLYCISEPIGFITLWIAIANLTMNPLSLFISVILRCCGSKTDDEDNTILELFALEGWIDDDGSLRGIYWTDEGPPQKHLLPLPEKAWEDCGMWVIILEGSIE